MSVEHTYNIGTTGRVKSAGVSLDYLYDPVEDFTQNPTLAGAQHIVESFHKLRHSPPDEIRDRFFPRKDENKGRFRTGSLMLRPILKTDQGAGKFLPFDVGSAEQSVIRYDVEGETGYVIPEVFFEKELVAHGNPLSVTQELALVESHFAQADIREAQLAYERMQIACGQAGIMYKRDAQVGRDALFFIRPARSSSPIVIPASVGQGVRDAIAFRANEFTDVILDERKRFAHAHGLIVRAQQIYEPLYFQTDVHMLPNGSVVIDQMHFPDVGLFLTSLDCHGNGALGHVQDRVFPLRDMVVETITRELARRKKQHVFLVTRPEVISENQDVLELREIQVLTQSLAHYGITAQPITPLEACALTPDDVGLLLNVNPKDDGFEKLLTHRLIDARTPIFPDPFLILAQQDMTGYQRIRLTNDHVEGLASIVKEVGQGSMDRSLLQLSALDNFLTKLGFTDDVFHMYISSHATPVACFRYDARGFQIALNYIQSGDAVELRAVPIDPQRSVLFEKDNRPLYGVFRFMAVKGGR